MPNTRMWRAGKSKPPRTPKLAGRPGSAPLQPSGNPFSSTFSHRIASTPVADASGSWQSEEGTKMMPVAPLATLGAYQGARSHRGVVPKVELRKKQDREAQVEEEPKEDASIRAGQRLYAEALKSLERQQTATRLTVQVSIKHPCICVNSRQDAACFARCLGHTSARPAPGMHLARWSGSSVSTHVCR